MLDTRHHDDDDDYIYKYTQIQFLTQVQSLTVQCIQQKVLKNIFKLVYILNKGYVSICQHKLSEMVSILFTNIFLSV